MRWRLIAVNIAVVDVAYRSAKVPHGMYVKRIEDVSRGGEFRVIRHLPEAPLKPGARSNAGLAAWATRRSGHLLKICRRFEIGPFALLHRRSSPGAWRILAPEPNQVSGIWEQDKIACSTLLGWISRGAR